MKNNLVVCIAVLCMLPVNHAIAQTATANNKPFSTVTYHPIPKGPSVYGIFEGRPLCRGIANQLQLATDADCVKLKCELVLYQDPVTFQPTNCTLSIVGGGDVIKQPGNPYRLKHLEGKWSVVKGIPANPGAEVYRLELPKPGNYIYLLKGDANVLFVLDENKAFMTGNEDFSYTLNRVELVPGNK